MLRKKIKYTDFDGIEREEDFFFNLTKAEMIEYDSAYEEQGGIMKYLTWLVDNKKQNELIKAFKDLILRSYGERNSAGRFIKSQEIRDSFMATEAYSELFMEITADEKHAAAFINGLFAGIPELKGKDLTKLRDELKDDNVVPVVTPLG